MTLKMQRRAGAFVKGFRDGAVVAIFNYANDSAAAAFAGLTVVERKGSNASAAQLKIVFPKNFAAAANARVSMG